MSRLAIALTIALSIPAFAQQGGRGGGQGAGALPPIPTIEERTAGLQKMDGYFPLYWEERTGNLYLEIPRFDTDFLYTTGLAAGLGSNDIGLDRGQEGGGKVVPFQRIGPRVLLVQGNESFRSSSPNPAERRSVEDSFAKSDSVGLHGGRRRQRPRPRRRHRLLPARWPRRRQRPRRRGTAAYRVDRTRSAFYLPRTKAFPKNTEIEVTLTFANEATGGRGGGGGGPSQGPPAIVVTVPGAAAAGAGRGGRAAASAADSSPAPSPASRPPPKPSRCASTIRWSNFPTTTTSRATTIRAPATAGSATSTTACPSASPW